jgi:hypothetical protein
MQGLNCKGLKRNWAKIKEKGLNRKGFASAGGYICEYHKKWGVFCKIHKAGWVDLVDSGLTRSRYVGSRSDGCDHKRAAGLSQAR